MKESILPYLQTVEDVEKKEIDWLIPYWVPKGGITLLVGDGGIGKTNLWSYLVSRLSTGFPTMLDNEDAERPTPGNVAVLKDGVLTEKVNTTCLYFSKEDSTAKRLKDNFERYDADMLNIHTVDVEHLSGFTFASSELEEMIDSLRPALVVFDPVQGFFPAGASMTSRQQSRETLDKLVRLGQQFNTAFLLVCHTNKRKTDDWRQRITGSADLPDIARSVIFTGMTGFRLETGERVQYISNEKNSYAPQETTVLYYLGAGGKVTYTGISGKRFEDYVAENGKGSSGPVGRKLTQKERCRELIPEILSDGEKMRIGDLNKALANAGIGRKAADLAKAELEQEGIIERWNEPDGGMPCWYIALTKGEEGEEGEEA